MKFRENMPKIITLIEALLYIFIYILFGVAFSSAIYDNKMLSPLDKPSIKIIFGIYLGWLGFVSFKLSRYYIEHDMISSLFAIESAVFITWGIIENYNYVNRSEYFSTYTGAIALLISLFIPYYYGNIHNSIFGGWKDKRK